MNELPCPSCQRPLHPPTRRHTWVLVAETGKSSSDYDKTYWCVGCGLLRHDAGWGPVVPSYRVVGSAESTSDEPECGPVGHRGVLINTLASVSSNVLSEREKLQQLRGIRGNKQTREQLKKMIEDSERRLASLESRQADLERIRDASYGEGHSTSR